MFENRTLRILLDEIITTSSKQHDQNRNKTKAHMKLAEFVGIFESAFLGSAESLRLRPVDVPKIHTSAAQILAIGFCMNRSEENNEWSSFERTSFWKPRILVSKRKQGLVTVSLSTHSGKKLLKLFLWMQSQQTINLITTSIECEWTTINFDFLFSFYCHFEWSYTGIMDLRRSYIYLLCCWCT